MTADSLPISTMNDPRKVRTCLAARPRTIFLRAFVLAFCLGICGCSREKREPANAPTALVVIASCDTAGWIEPCGCASGQSGGLSRRATLHRDLTSGRPGLLVSIGGAAAGDKPYDIEKLRAILLGESIMGYDFHNLGESELQLSESQLADVSQKVQFLSSNVFKKDGKPLAKRFAVHEVAEHRVLVLGAVDPTFVSSRYRAADPAKAIQDSIQLAGRQGPFTSIILLAYLNRESMMQIAAQFPEVDVVLGGPNSQSVSPKLVGSTLVTAVSNKGKFLARAVRETSETGEQKWTADLHEVRDKWAEDPLQQENLTAFRQRLRDFDFSANQTSFVQDNLSLPNGGPKFAGSSSCRACHTQDQERWNGSAHSHAWETIQDVGAEVDASCQRCHTTGFGQPGGFVKRTTSADRLDVGCESCHGPSSEHVADPINRTPWQASESCVSCHDHENSPHFNYDEYWPQIEHGSPAIHNTPE